MSRALGALLAATLAAAGCDVERALPPSPAAAHAGAEAAMAARLEAHLRGLPGVARASVLVQLPAADPLARAAPPLPPARLAIALVTAPGTDPSPLRAAATSAATTVAGAGATIAVDVAAPPPPAPALTAVGPFRVAPGSRGPLLATLALALVAIAGLALALATALARRRPARS